MAQTFRHHDKLAAPRFAGFEAWAFLLPMARDFRFSAAVPAEQAWASPLIHEMCELGIDPVFWQKPAVN